MITLSRFEQITDKNMPNFFPKTASSQQVQRHYRSLFNHVIESKEPLIILNNNKPEVVIIDIGSYEKMRKKISEFDEIKARTAISIYQKEKQNDSLKELKSLSQISNED